MSTRKIRLLQVSYKKLLLFYIVCSTLFSIITSSLQVLLNDGRERCFIEELYISSVISVKWKVKLGSMISMNKHNMTQEEISRMIPEKITKNIFIMIRDEESNEVLKTFLLESNKGKNSFQSNKNGFHKICVKYTGFRLPGDEIYFSMKFYSNNMDDPNIYDAIRNKDIEQILHQVNMVVEKSKEITNKQNLEIKDEDHYANLQMEITYNYNYLNGSN